MAALPAAPAVIAAPHDHVDLLAHALADVAGEQGARVAVEREAPRVAQPVRPHRRAERVVGRHGVGLPGALARVDAQDLAEQRAEVLGVRDRRVVGVPAVADARVEHPVPRPERELAAVVVAGLGVGDGQHDAAGPGDRAVRVGGALELPDLDLTPGGGEIDVGEAAGGVVGREGDREQAALPAGQHLGAEVREGLGLLRAGLDELHAPALLDHEQPRGIAGRRGDVHGRVEAADRRERRRRVRPRRPREQRGGGEQRRPHQCSATVPSSGSSGSPRPCHSVMPPSTEYAS